MSRIAAITLEEMAPEQRSFYDEVMSQRGRVRGPFSVLMHAPELGSQVARLVEHFHLETRVPMALKELVILQIARHYTAQYEWLVHEPRARRAGVPDTVIEALRTRQGPQFEDAGMAATFALVEEILVDQAVSDMTYDRAMDLLGESRLVELIVHVGFYISIAVLLTVFQVEVPQGEEIPLGP